MPTENRSSNTEMVSVQATIESLEEAYAGDSALEFMNDAAHLLRQFKSISTLQHQGEPVVSQCALCCQAHEHVAVGRVGGKQANGCDVDFTTWRCEGCGGSWSGDLEDPGDVERMHKGHIKSLEALNEQTEKQRDHWMAECKKRDAKLSGRDALLREALEFIDDGVGRSDAEWQLIQKLRSALSASAEPSAPVERDELMELLRDMTYAYRGAIQAGYDRITSLGGDCDSVDKMLADIPAYAKARAALERNPS